MSDFHCMIRPSSSMMTSCDHYHPSSDGDSESEDGMMEMENINKYTNRNRLLKSKKRSRSPSLSKENNNKKRSEKISSSTTTKALAGLEALASAAVMTKDSPLSPMPSLDPQTPNSPLSSSSTSSSSPPSPAPSTVPPLSPPPTRLPLSHPSSSSSSSSLFPLNGVCICSKCLPVDTLHPDVLIERLLLIQQRLPRTDKTNQQLSSLESLRYLSAEIKLKLPSMVKSYLTSIASQYFGINKHSHNNNNNNNKGLITSAIRVTRPVAVPSPSILHKISNNFVTGSMLSPLSS